MKSSLLKLIIFVSLFIFWVGFASAQTVSLSSQTTEVAKNTTFSVAVNISSVTNLFGVSFDLDFNPSLINFVSAAEGAFLKQGCQTSLMTAENPAGKLIFGLTRLGSSCGGVSGSGTIATLNFKSLGITGSSNLSFSKNSLCILSGSACNYITGTWNSGSVDVKVTADTLPPVRSNSSPSGTLPVGTTQTTLSLSTNENATCKYSTTAGTAYSSMTNTFSTTGALAHSTTVSSLQNGQTYRYYVRCQDRAGNSNTDDFTITFSVASPTDTTPPTISNVNSSSITSSGATITWTTNEVSDSQVEYGLTASYGFQTTLNTSMVTSHSVSLSGLSSLTTYHYRVKSKDAAGNLATAGDYTFTTTCTLGDLDCSGSVTISDIQLAINVFLETETRPEIVSRADVNSDGKTNVIDIQRIVNIVLGG